MGKTKKPEPWSILRGLIWAPALKALASMDIDEQLALALAAVDRQALGVGLNVGADHLGPASRAAEEAASLR